MSQEDRWAMGVRILALLSAVLMVLAVLEGAALRRARAELQQLRTEREDAKAGLTSPWAKESAGEFREALRRLDTFYADPADGLGRAQGLCAGGRIDDEAVATFAFGRYLPARASGRSLEASLSAMRDALVASDAYRARHAIK